MLFSNLKDAAYKTKAWLRNFPRQKVSEVAEQHQNMNSTEDDSPSRYEPCFVLWEAGITSRIWLEDALAHIGVPTEVFELFLLVTDVGAAAQALLSAGYQKQEPCLAFSSIPQFNDVYGPAESANKKLKNDAHSAANFSTSETGVIILPAEEWFHPLPPHPENMEAWFPTLSELLTALITKWLGLEEQDSALLLRIAIYIGYIYGYVDAVKEEAFMQQIPQEYWLFHQDRLQGHKTAELGTFACQQQYLQQIFAFKQALRDCLDTGHSKI